MGGGHPSRGEPISMQNSENEWCVDLKNPEYHDVAKDAAHGPEIWRGGSKECDLGQRV